MPILTAEAFPHDLAVSLVTLIESAPSCSCRSPSQHTGTQNHCFFIDLQIPYSSASPGNYVVSAFVCLLDITSPWAETQQEKGEKLWFLHTSVTIGRAHFVTTWCKQSVFAVSKSVLSMQNFTELSLFGGDFVGLPHSIVEEPLTS